MLPTRHYFYGLISIATASWAYFIIVSVDYNPELSASLAANAPVVSCRQEGPSSQTNASSTVSSILQALDPKEKWEYPEIDVVYTWVDGSKAEWLKLKNEYRVKFIAELENKSIEQVKREDKIKHLDKSPNRGNRYKDHQELRYSIRSVMKHAPWVRNIYLVTHDGKSPSWLNVSHPKIKMVSHPAIFSNHSYLPTFSSRPIEASLPNIPGISDYFLFFNDDFFLGEPVSQSDFLPDPTTGSQRVFLDFWELPDCSEKCRFKMLGNGRCNGECNNAACNWDMGDCGIDARVEGMKKHIQDQKNVSYTRNSGYFMAANHFIDGFFNREMGKNPLGTKRGPIAHLPYLINKRLYKDVIQRFSEQYERTLSHRFRHTEDFQLSFTYFHYYIFQKVYAPSRKQIWRAALMTVKHQEPFLYGNYFDTDNKYQEGKRHVIESTESFRLLRKCSALLVGLSSGGSELSKSFLASCEDAVDKLFSEYQIRLPLKYLDVVQKEDIQKIYYLQKITDNERKWKRRLKQPAKKPRKFICFEDDLVNGTNPLVEERYIMTFETLYPDPSPMEIVSEDYTYWVKSIANNASRDK